MNRCCSTKDFPASSSFSSSRTARNFAKTPGRSSDVFIGYDLQRRSNLQQWVSQAKIDGVEPVNPLKIHDVLEVPAYQNVHASTGGDRDMGGVRLLSLS